jgi:hypothetical protein
MVVALIEAGQFTAFPDALRFVVAVKAAEIRVAAASSSKNARLLLGKVRLHTYCEPPPMAAVWRDSTGTCRSASLPVLFRNGLWRRPDGAREVRSDTHCARAREVVQGSFRVAASSR